MLEILKGLTFAIFQNLVPHSKKTQKIWKRSELSSFTIWPSFFFKIGKPSPPSLKKKIKKLRKKGENSNFSEWPNFCKFAKPSPSSHIYKYNWSIKQWFPLSICKPNLMTRQSETVRNHQIAFHWKTDTVISDNSSILSRSWPIIRNEVIFRETSKKCRRKWARRSVQSVGTRRLTAK